jgi:hypothetical protein
VKFVTYDFFLVDKHKITYKENNVPGAIMNSVFSQEVQ